MHPRGEEAMARSDDGGSAFPTFAGAEGMSLRDWFAGRAMVALLLKPDRVDENGVVLWTSYDPSKDDDMEHLASDSYETADAMLNARDANDGTS